MSAVTHIAADEAPPKVSRGWPRERVVGYVFVGLWALAGKPTPLPEEEAKVVAEQIAADAVPAPATDATKH